MPIELLMPALSPTMTEGTLAKWAKKEGDKIKSGDVLAEIETDKATMEFEAVDEGILGRIVVPAGTQGVKVNQLIALILEDGEEASAMDKPAAHSASVAPAPVAVALPPAVIATAAAPAAHASGSRLFASPLARRLADQAGLSLDGIAGSGPHGRIVKADVDAAVKTPPAPKPKPVAAAAPAPVAAPSASVTTGDYEDIPNSSMRKIIAKRMTESRQTIPTYDLTIDCELDALLKIREEFNNRSKTYKLSVNDFVIRAVALSLRKVPQANASWTEAAIRRYKNVDIAVAVASPTGLLTPVIRNADHKGLADISTEMKDLALKARDGKLLPEEYQGGSVSITNLGMYGIKHFNAIINPPQSIILAVGSAEQRPVVKNGALAIATVMTCTLTVDHRVMDGAVGATFLQAFKPLIEDPLSMLL